MIERHTESPPWLVVLRSLAPTDQQIATWIRRARTPQNADSLLGWGGA